MTRWWPLEAEVRDLKRKLNLLSPVIEEALERISTAGEHGHKSGTVRRAAAEPRRKELKALRDQYPKASAAQLHRHLKLVGMKASVSTVSRDLRAMRQAAQSRR